jgi:hypothetical protein
LISLSVLLSAAFLIFYPIGAILAQLGAPVLKVHVPCQIFTLVTSIAGVGIGIKLADLTQNDIGGNSHTVIGLVVVFALLAIQPIGGWLQHKYAVNAGGKRSVWGFAHIWFGRAMIVLGILNGGLGLVLGGDQHDPKRAVPYIVIAAVVGTVYLATIIWGLVKTGGRSERIAGSTGEKVLSSQSRQRIDLDGE